MAADRARGARIILADPDPEARCAAAEALRAVGFSVVEAATGAEAETAFWAEPNTELLVAAGRLPGVSGSRLAAILRALRPSLKVVLIDDGRARPEPSRAAEDLVSAVRQALGAR